MSIEPPRDALIDASWRVVELLRKAGREPGPELTELLVAWELRLAEQCAEWHDELL